MTALSDLIARLEAAKEGSRELDVDIARHIGLRVVPEFYEEPDLGDWFLVPDNWVGEVPDDAQDHASPSYIYENDWKPVPDYTTSIDASLTIKLDHDNFSVGIWTDRLHWDADIDGIGGYGATKILALCSAALKAREAAR